MQNQADNHVMSRQSDELFMVNPDSQKYSGCFKQAQQNEVEEEYQQVNNTTMASTGHFSSMQGALPNSFASKVQEERRKSNIFQSDIDKMCNYKHSFDSGDTMGGAK